MYYYAYLDSNDICVQIYAMPAPISGDQFIAISSDDQTLVGQKFNRTTSEFEVVYYYAVLDDRGIVESVTFSVTQQTTSDTLLSITFTQYQTVVGMYWNGTAFVEPPISVVAVASTDEVNYKAQDKWLSTKLDEMDTAIAAIASAISGKAASSHSHAASDLSGVVKTVNGTAPDANGNVVIAGGSGEAGADGADGEDGVTFTPSVSADGVLSWTNDGGLENPAPVNIKGADGAAGAAGADGEDGVDGVSPTVSVSKSGTVTTITITDATGSHTATINDGAAGAAGQDGADGEDGVDGTSCSHYWSGTTLVVTSASGTSSANLKGDKGDKGDDGADGADGQDFDGNLTGGVLRLQGNQAAFFSGTQMVYGTNNYPTRIAGNAITATKTIVVDSDKRLKKNIAAVDAQACEKLINGIKVKTYSYKADSEPCVGVIAQEMLAASPEIANYLVKKNESGYYGVKTADLVFPLIVAVQRLTARVAELEKPKV